MVKRISVFIVLGLLLLAACTGGGGKVTIKPFIGGTQGIIIAFDKNAPPSQVYDGGDFPFDVIVKLTNKGEALAAKDKVTVKITGIRAQEFNVKETDLVKSPLDDIIQRRTDSSGKTVESSDVFVEFNNFNRVSYITGSALTYPIRAEVCYGYSTQAAASLCVRRNLANPEENGICVIDGARPLSTSGAPVQISDVTEFQRGRDSVGFSFIVKNAGPANGKIFAKDSKCEGTRSVEDRVIVNVKTDIPGLSCQGLSATRDGQVEGIIPLFETTRTVTCTQKVDNPADFEAPVTVTLSYDYRDHIETDVVVKHSGDSDTASVTTTTEQ